MSEQGLVVDDTMGAMAVLRAGGEKAHMGQERDNRQAMVRLMQAE